MILCFLLSAGNLLSAKHGGADIFYRENPPAVASANNEKDAREYIDQLKPGANISGGVLTSHTVGGKAYKVFIAKKTVASPRDLRYFVGLIANKDRIFREAMVAHRTAVTEAEEARKIVAEHAERQRVTNLHRVAVEQVGKGGYTDPNDRGRILGYIERSIQQGVRHAPDLLPVVTNEDDKKKDSDVILMNINDILRSNNYRSLKKVGLLNPGLKEVTDEKKPDEKWVLGKDTIH